MACCIRSPIRRRNPLAFGDAFRCAHFELPANQRTFFVDGAHHAVPIQRGAPAVIQPQHDFPTPIVGIDKTLGHACVGDQHDFKLAAAGRAGRAGDRRFGDLRMGNSFHGAQCKPVGLRCVKGLTDAQTSWQIFGWRIVSLHALANFQSPLAGLLR